MLENQISEIEKHLDSIQKILEDIGKEKFKLLNSNPTDLQNLARLQDAIEWYFTVKHLNEIVRRL